MRILNLHCICNYKMCNNKVDGTKKSTTTAKQHKTWYLKKMQKICLVKTKQNKQIWPDRLHITTAIADKASFLIRSPFAPCDGEADASRQKIQITAKRTKTKVTTNIFSLNAFSKLTYNFALMSVS